MIRASHRQRTRSYKWFHSKPEDSWKKERMKKTTKKKKKERERRKVRHYDNIGFEI